MENSLKWQALKRLSFRAAFTLTSTTSKDPRFPGNDLSRIPRETASLTTTWRPIDPLELSLIYTYTGTRFNAANNALELADFHTVDLYSTWQVNEWVKCFGRAENLPGYRYQQAAFFPAVGRAFYGGVEVQY